jgi:hypothetical protein
MIISEFRRMHKRAGWLPEPFFDMDQRSVFGLCSLLLFAGWACVTAALPGCQLNWASCADDSACVRKTEPALPAVVAPQCGQMTSPRSQGRAASALNWNSLSWNGRAQVWLTQRIIRVSTLVPCRRPSPKVVPFSIGGLLFILAGGLSDGYGEKFDKYQ